MTSRVKLLSPPYGGYNGAFGSRSRVAVRDCPPPGVVMNPFYRPVVFGPPVDPAPDPVLVREMERLRVGGRRVELPEEESGHNDGFCYLEVVDERYHDEAIKACGSWPTMRQVASLPPEWFASLKSCCETGVSVRGNTLHFRRRIARVGVTALDVLRCARKQLVGGFSPLVFGFELLDAVVGGEPPLPWIERATAYHCVYPVINREELQRAHVAAHAVATTSCTVAFLQQVFGKVVMRAGDSLEQVLPYDVAMRLLDGVSGQVRATVVHRAQQCCLIPFVDTDDPCARSGSLREMLLYLYRVGAKLCVPQPDSGQVQCEWCCFDGANPTHAARCRLPVGMTTEAVKLEAWWGDGVHVLDVRNALLRAEVPSSRATIEAVKYVGAAGQASYMRLVMPDYSRGKSDKQLSTAFEAMYGQLRESYLPWLYHQLAHPSLGVGTGLTDWQYGLCWSSELARGVRCDQGVSFGGCESAFGMRNGSDGGSARLAASKCADLRSGAGGLPGGSVCASRWKFPLSSECDLMGAVGQVARKRADSGYADSCLEFDKGGGFVRHLPGE
nr:MAG: hypothetical protein [Aspergillus flavus vivivirus 1]